MIQIKKPLSPEQFAHEIVDILPQCTAAERTRLMEHAHAWATVSYNGEVPPELAAHLRTLEAQWQS